MISIAASPQSDALEQRWLAQSEVPEPALRALQRVRERELMLFRMVLAESPVLGDTVPSLGRDGSPALAYRALRG